MPSTAPSESASALNGPGSQAGVKVRGPTRTSVQVLLRAGTPRLGQARRSGRRAGPSFECPRECGRLGEPDEIRGLVDRRLSPAEVVQRELVPQLVEDDLEGDALGLELAVEGLPADGELPGY